MLSSSAAPSKNEATLAFGKHTLHLNYELRITNYELRITNYYGTGAT
ncbi:MULTISPECIES: hypothetical protein [Nostoc]|uniref:Uncharacterized protein n=1 Tax=Nostoc paludosum FACHB-159 TaxID=2692908 RepID=A0ABR8KA87_9NOSO|nr:MULTISPECIES: hypothetical protein [Nostoc]MBD2680178.1 hypothetical protein [Nostoc sp. FACHB-857]MBD2736415.1 hypothetical protein [Nostoc paludosum FACHB-159]